jgi:O-antigen/teichoic acid export membrane protein
MMVVATGEPELGGPRPPRFTSAALATFSAQLAAALLSFVSVLIVSRALGPSGRGDVAFLTTIAVLSSNVALLGVQEAHANFAAAEPQNRRALATNSLILSLLLGAACIALLAALVALFPALAREPWTLLALALGSIPMLILQTYLQFFVSADYAFGMYNLSWVITPLLTVVVNGVLAALHRLTVTIAFGNWVAAQGAATILLLWFVARRSVGFGRPELALARRALGFGLRTHFGRLMMFGNYRADQWFVGSMAGSRQLGLYSIAVAWSEVLFYLPSALVIVQRPYLVRAERGDAARRAARVFRAGILLTALLTLVVILLAPVLCVTVFGSDFRGSIVDLRVLALGAIGIVAVKQLGNALTAQRRPGLTSIAATIAFALSIVLDVVLIPSHGGLGAAIASTISYSVGGVAIAVLFVRIFALSPAELIPRGRELPTFIGEVWRLRSGSEPAPAVSGRRPSRGR